MGTDNIEDFDFDAEYQEMIDEINELKKEVNSIGKKLDDFNKKLQQTVREMYEEKGILPKGYSLTDIQ